MTHMTLDGESLRGDCGACCGAERHLLRESRDAMMYALSRMPPVPTAKIKRKRPDGTPHSSRVRMMRAVAAINALLGDSPK